MTNSCTTHQEPTVSSRSNALPRHIFVMRATDLCSKTHELSSSSPLSHNPLLQHSITYKSLVHVEVALVGLGLIEGLCWLVFVFTIVAVIDVEEVIDSLILIFGMLFIFQGIVIRVTSWVASKGNVGGACCVELENAISLHYDFGWIWFDWCKK